MNNATKWCPGCDRDLPLSAFYKRGDGRLVSRCIECGKAAPRASRARGIYRTKSDITDLSESLCDIVTANFPMTVRQVFYQATVRGLISKDEKGYYTVQRLLAKLRRDDDLPFEYIIDGLRTPQQPYTCDGIADALADTAKQYRKSLWTDKDCRVQIWCEKDALAGVIQPITDKYDVALMTARGFSSITFLHDAATTINTVGQPTHIYHFGDFDPSGQDAARAIEQDLEEMVDETEIYFTRAAVTEEQIEEFKLPSRPTKMSDPRSGGFGDISVELDAFDPKTLQAMVQIAINKHMPEAEYKKLMKAEAAERAELNRLIKNLRGPNE